MARWILLLVLLATPRALFAQDLAPVRGFSGAGMLASTDDADARLGRSGLQHSRLWLFDFSVPISRRLGLGAELIPLGSVDAYEPEKTASVRLSLGVSARVGW